MEHAPYNQKLDSFSLIENKGRFTLILKDRGLTEKPSDEERESVEWGTITWRLPFVISRYLGRLTPEQKKIILLPHVVPLRQMQGLLIASIGMVRDGFAQTSMKVQDHLVQLLNDFTRWAEQVEETLKSSETAQHNTCTIRFAQPNDAEQIYRFICDLAEFEHSASKVETTPEMIYAQLASVRPPFECLFTEQNGTAVGFALFFQNYSTWTGKPGLHLEDIYVVPSHRTAGVGKMLLRQLAAIALERNYGRIEWSVLNWNENMQRFSRSLGAEDLSEWATWRLDRNTMARLASQ